MKIRFLFLIILFSHFSFSQTVIKGTVYHQKGTLENVAVYFNNTMLGTTTNKNGEFSITVKEGQHQLIISYLGYKTINYSLNTKNYKKPLIFTLLEYENQLDEIIIKKTIYDDVWKYNFQKFEENFIGKTLLSKECKILNPKVLHFEYNAKENILTAYPRAPLKIRHQGLGYLITYDLVDFQINKNLVTYLGYSRYQNLKGGKRKQKRWKKNRLKSYYGSAIHFLKSAIKNKIYEEGYSVNQFKRVLNPERPSEKEIKMAREFIKLQKLRIDYIKKPDATNNAIDSALITLQKARLPKFKDYLYKTKVPQSEIITVKENIPYLDFNHNLIVIYKKEKEERGYILRNVFSKYREPTFQTSNLIPVNRPAVIDHKGVLLNPLDVYFEGYWSYEKLGDTLPLDYQPPKD